MCARAWQANPQALYDWMEVNIGDAAGRHRELIPDGRLCSAGRAKYAAFDEPGEWPVTRLTSGPNEFVYRATAPHATEYYRLYVTRPGFDGRTDRIGWDDLDLVHDSGPLARHAEYRFSVSLPERSAPAVIYTVWQRSDSPEAFYSCSDVLVSGSGSPPIPPPDTAPPTSAPPSPGPPAPTPPAPGGPPTPAPSTPGPPSPGGPPTPAPAPAPPTPPTPGAPPPTTWPPSTTPSRVAGLRLDPVDTAVWAAGRCTQITVTNTDDRTVRWEVAYEPGGEIAALWNAEPTGVDAAGVALFAGASWNRRLGPGQSTAFGMCVDL